MNDPVIDGGYSVAVTIKGVKPLLHHAFTSNQLDSMAEQAKQRTGAENYAYEWLPTMHIVAENGTNYLCQPAIHIESAMLKAAGAYKIPGRRGKTWKDPIQAYVRVSPDDILHLREGDPRAAPGPDLLENPRDGLSVFIARVRVQRAAVARSRLMLDPGWELSFQIDVNDTQLNAGVLETILSEAGRAVGISDWRPRYGLFQITEFDVLNGA